MSTTPTSERSQSRAGTPDLSVDYGAKLKDLVLLYTPSKSGREMTNLRAQLAAGLDEQARAYQHCKRHLVDAENDVNDPRKRARRSLNHRTDGVEEDSPIFSATELEERARRHGRKFVILCGLWLALGTGDVESFFSTALDDEYDAEFRFCAEDAEHNEHEERQGQLREVKEILPDDLLPFFERSWFAKAFNDGMKSQRSNTATRLRKGGLSHIVTDLQVHGNAVTTAQLATSDSRLRHFTKCIGWNEAKSKYYYWDVPLLHGNESDTLNYDEVFRHPLLLKIFVTILRGAAAANGVMDKQPLHPKASTMQRIFQINHTTPGAIASCAVWAIWLFSGDGDFSEVGDVTGINYYHRFNEHLDKIFEGLRRRQKWARDLFLFWDNHVFPETNGSRYGGGVSKGDEDVRVELAGATDALLEMPSVSDDEDNA